MAISRVQTAYKAQDGNPGSTTLATSSITTTSGNLLVVMTRDGAVNSVTGISDGTNTYSKIAEDINRDPGMSIWYASNITGVTGAITATWAGNHNYAWLYVIEYSGLALTSPLDASASGARSSPATVTDITTSSFSTANASSVVVVATAQNAFANYTAGTDFTLVDGTIHDASGNYGGVEEYITSSTLSSYTAHITSSVSASFAVVWATFKAAAASSSRSGLLPLLGVS